MGNPLVAAALNVGTIAIADPTGVCGLFYRNSASATNTPLTLPAISATDPRVLVRGRWMSIFSSAVNIQYAFGIGAAPTLVFNQTVAPGTGSAAAGPTIPAGQIVSFIVPSQATHISLIAGASPTGTVEIYITEGPG